MEDYRDFLRVRKMPLWDKNHPQAQAVRMLARGSNVSYETYETYVEHSPPEIAANTIICLIHQTNYLLDQQLRSLEAAFVKEGGLRERMTRAASRRGTRKAHESHRTYMSHRSHKTHSLRGKPCPIRNPSQLTAPSTRTSG